MSQHDYVINMLQKHDNDIHTAAVDIYGGPKKIAIYVIEIALEYLKSRERALHRREIRRQIGLAKATEERRHTGFGLSSPAKKKLLANTQKLFGHDGWMIGAINVQDFTREGLLDEAARERRKSGGHIINAQIYETLAEPMQPGQLVREHWTLREVAKIKKSVVDERSEARV